MVELIINEGLDTEFKITGCKEYRESLVTRTLLVVKDLILGEKVDIQTPKSCDIETLRVIIDGVDIKLVGTYTKINDCSVVKSINDYSVNVILD